MKKGDILCWKREWARWDKKVSDVRKEEWMRWKVRLGKVEKESGLGRKRKYHPSLCARVIL